MPAERKNEIKVIIDTNIWISFLIGKRLGSLQKGISHLHIKLIISNELIEEIETISKRPKIAKYFPEDKVRELLVFLRFASEQYKIKEIPTVCRDAKDDFLLALSEISRADYLVTSDNDLLVLEKYINTKIISVKDFEEIVSRL